MFRTDRDEARERGTKYTEARGRVEPFTDEQLAEFYKLYEAEEIRGATPRYWEDVKEGEALPRMMKGPMTVTGFICYAQGWGGLYIRANKLAWKMQSKHPGLGIKNRFNVPDCPERVHWDEAFALEVGAPGAYDYGPERCSWLTHHITNWMGDDGFLRKSHANSAATIPTATCYSSTVWSAENSWSRASIWWKSTRMPGRIAASCPRPVRRP